MLPLEAADVAGADKGQTSSRKANRLKRCTLAGHCMRSGLAHAVTPRAPLPTTSLLVCLLLARPNELEQALFSVVVAGKRYNRPQSTEVSA